LLPYFIFIFAGFDAELNIDISLAAIFFPPSPPFIDIFIFHYLPLA